MACPLCKADPFLTGNACKVIKDKFPVSEGHLLVVPNRHVPRLRDLDDLEASELWLTAVHLVREKVDADFTVGINDGRLAGQTIEHVHLHVIPRFQGDNPDPRGGIRWVVPHRAAYDFPPRPDL